jgi:uncharacterized protein YhaN
VAPDLVGSASADAVVDLHARLLRDLNTARIHEEKEKDAAEARGRLSALQSEAAGVEARIQALRAEAGCETAAGMAERIERAARRRTVEKERQDAERALAEVAGACTLEELEVQAAELPQDRIPGMIEELEREIGAASARRDLALTEKDAFSRKIAELASRADAVAAAADVEAAEAELRDLSEQFMRLTMAAQILRQSVEEHGRREQGPMLGRSSAIFAQLTRNSFDGLQLDVDAENSVLVGVRPGGKTVPLEGMSDGTRDQLYLALRVASLELYFERQPPVPIILDDLLVHFDERRARGALEVLADLARKTQVLLFTHHLHVVELARECVAPDRLAVYGVESALGA